MLLSCLPGASRCLGGCPTSPFLLPWRLPGASQVVHWSFPASLVPPRLSNWSCPASLVPLRLSNWSFPASLVPPWCFAGCPISPFLSPWCLPGASVPPFAPAVVVSLRRSTRSTRYLPEIFAGACRRRPAGVCPLASVLPSAKQIFNGERPGSRQILGWARMALKRPFGAPVAQNCLSKASRGTALPFSGPSWHRNAFQTPFVAPVAQDCLSKASRGTALPFSEPS